MLKGGGSGRRRTVVSPSSNLRGLVLEQLRRTHRSQGRVVSCEVQAAGSSGPAGGEALSRRSKANWHADRVRAKRLRGGGGGVKSEI